MERLRNWMDKQNMNQVDLARAMNISESAISLVLSGKRELSESFIGRFFLAFGPAATCEVFDHEGVASPSL